MESGLLGRTPLAQTACSLKKHIDLFRGVTEGRATTDIFQLVWRRREHIFWIPDFIYTEYDSERVRTAEFLAA